MMTYSQILQASPKNLRTGIVEVILETSPVLSRLPFVSTDGYLHYEWSLQKKLPASGFRPLNSEYQSTSSEYDRGRIDLKPLGGTVKMDRLFADHPTANMVSVYENEVRARARSASMAFKRAMIKGNKALNPAEFDGLQTWFDDGTLAGQTVDLAPAGSTFTALGAEATLNKLHEAIHKCIVIPDFILANRTIISQLASLALAAAGNEAFANYFRMGKVEIGNGRMASVGELFGIPVFALDTDEQGNEILSFNEARPDNSGNDCASMYFVCSGAGFTFGLQQTPDGVRVFEHVTTEGHRAVSIDWPAAIVTEHPRAVARLRGIRAA